MTGVQTCALPISTLKDASAFNVGTMNSFFMNPPEGGRLLLIALRPAPTQGDECQAGQRSLGLQNWGNEGSLHFATPAD